MSWWVGRGFGPFAGKWLTRGGVGGFGLEEECLQWLYETLFVIAEMRVGVGRLTRFIRKLLKLVVLSNNRMFGWKIQVGKWVS